MTRNNSLFLEGSGSNINGRNVNVGLAVSTATATKLSTPVTATVASTASTATTTTTATAATALVPVTVGGSLGGVVVGAVSSLGLVLLFAFEKCGLGTRLNLALPNLLALVFDVARLAHDE